MKHTQGKWKTVTDEKGIYIMPESAWYSSNIDAYIGEEIAEIKFPFGDGDGNENAESDAKLISKAPEMYEALKSFLKNGGDAELYIKVQDIIKELES